MYLAILRRHRGQVPEAPLKRVEVLAWQQELDEASRALQQYRSAHPDDTRATVMHAHLTRHLGDPAAALHHLSALSIQTLIDDGYLVQTVFLSPGFAWVWDPTAGELSLSYDAAEEPNIPDADNDGDGDQADIDIIGTW